MLRAWAVVPAAGCGQRFGDDCPKQFSCIHGYTLISYTIISLLACEEVDKVIVVTSDESKVGCLPTWWMYELDDEGNIKSAAASSCKTSTKSLENGSPSQHHKDSVNEDQVLEPESSEQRVVFVPGSTSRHRSIKCGLDAAQRLVEDGLALAPDVVLVHDGVRPLVPPPLVTALVTAAATDGAAGLTRPLVSTVLEVPPDQSTRLGRSLDRSAHRASETPQAFTYDVIRRAYQQCSEHELDHGTECLQLALTHTGVAARLLDGSPDLWKVTYRRDLHAFRGVVDDTITRPAVVSTAASLDGTRDLLVNLLSPRLLRTAAAAAADLTEAFSCVVLLRSPTGADTSPGEISVGDLTARAYTAVTATAETETDREEETGKEDILTAAASRLDRRVPGYAVDVRVGWPDGNSADSAGPGSGPAAEADELYRRTGKWLCRVNCAEVPADGGRRLAAMITAVLLSEDGAFHGQVLRL